MEWNAFLKNIACPAAQELKLQSYDRESNALTAKPRAYTRTF